MNDKPLKPWLIIFSDSAIASAHCSCMAGLGEVCSYAAAIAFSLYFKDLTNDEVSCTDRLSVWPVPKMKNIVPKKIKEIDWGQTMKSFTSMFINISYSSCCLFK